MYMHYQGWPHTHTPAAPLLLLLLSPSDPREGDIVFTPLDNGNGNGNDNDEEEDGTWWTGWVK